MGEINESQSLQSREGRENFGKGKETPRDEDYLLMGGDRNGGGFNTL